MNNVIPFVSKGAKVSDDGDILDHGKISNVKYEVYKRGVIHIFDEKHRFKKNIDSFEATIEKLDFEKLEDGKDLIVEGSGDNDNIVFTKKDGDISISFKAKGFKTIEKLREILSIKRFKKEATSGK